MRKHLSAQIALALLLLAAPAAAQQLGPVNPPYVQGPASATDGHLAEFDGATGKLVKDGGVPATGTVTSITCNGGLTGGAITTTGTCAADFGTTSGKVLQGAGALGTPASGDASNLTNIPVNQAKSGAILPAANGGAGTISGILKANGSGTVSAATSSTDYAPATPAGTAFLRSNNTGGFTAFSWPASFAVDLNSDQTGVASATETTINFNHARSDTGSLCSLASTFKCTLTTAGWWDIYVSFQATGTLTVAGQAQCLIRQDGTTNVQVFVTYTAVAGAVMSQCHTKIYSSGTTYVEGRVSVASTGTFSIAGNTVLTNMQGNWTGPTQ